MEKEDVIILNQLVRALEEAELSLEEGFQKNDFEKFSESKKIMMNIQKKIEDMIK